MDIKVDYSALTVDDIFKILDSIRIYDSCEGFKDQELYDLFEVLRKIKLYEIRDSGFDEGIGSYVEND